MNGDDPPELRTRRLTLQPANAADVADLHRHWSRPAVRRFLWDDRPVARDTVADLVTRSRTDFRTHGFGLWVLRLRAEPTLAGFCGLRAVEGLPLARGAAGGQGQDLVELLYSLEPARWGHGLATEAAQAVLVHAFDTVGLTQVVACADEGNAASVRTLTRLGMAPREAPLLGGHRVPYFTVSRVTLRRPDPDGPAV